MAFGQTNRYVCGDHGQLMQRITPDRVWTAGQRDARGRLLQATTAVNGTSVLVETMHWRANSTLNDYSAARPGTWNETRNYGYNPRGQLTNETLKPSASGSLNASYGYDTNRLGVLTGASFAGSFNNTWLAPSGQPDGFGRVTEEQWDLAQRELWTQGHAPGAGQVSVALDGQPLNEVRYDPNQPDGLWEGRMAIGPGTHSLVATATHLSGLVTAATNHTFTASTTNTLTEAYDGMGNVTNRTLPGGRVQTLGWDPLGRLVSITERVDTATNWTWTATYDPFSRRLSSTYRPLTINDQPSTINQFYDPQVEFLEIGVSLNGVRTWKIHGPDLNGRHGGLMGVGGLEATVRESDGIATGLLSDAFGNGVATIRGGTVTWTPVPVAGYGPVLGYTPPQLSDYHSLAEVSLWRGQRLDPTGLYWRGKRYYDARAGRFLSPDPLSHAASWDLYSFARNDPVNFFDPDGRAGYFFDGTWNWEGQAEHEVNAPTNVRLLFESYAKPNGTKFYYRGVGNEADHAWAMQIVQGATGVGTSANLELAYKNLLGAYNAGDRIIDVYGFSRGGAAAIEFVQAIYDRGIPDLSSARTIFRDRGDRGWTATTVYDNYLVSPGDPGVVRCLGLFDPVYAMAFGSYRGDIAPNTEYAFAAYALDERRVAFTQADVPSAYSVGFKGIHSNVGGGYEDRGLSDIALDWMFQMSGIAGVSFRPIPLAPDPNGAVGDESGLLFKEAPRTFPGYLIGVGMARRPPLPPNRTGGFPASGSPVSGLGEHWTRPHGLRLRRLARGSRRSHWASVDGPARGHVRFLCAFCAGCSATVGESTCPTEERWSGGCAESISSSPAGCSLSLR